MSLPVPALPEYFALKSKSNGKYLKYEPNSGGRLQFSGDELVSPYVKFHSNGVTQHPKEGPSSTAYHLRCCYNNKYLQKTNQSGSLISGTGDTLEEDTSKWSCTLFKPEFDGQRSPIRLVHIHSGGYLSRGSETSQGAGDCLVVAGPAAEQAEVFEVVDYSESVVMLPKIVAFREDKGKGKYLKAEEYLPIIPGALITRVPTFRALMFTTESLEKRSTAHEVVMNKVDGTIRIISTSDEGKRGFWKRNERERGWVFWDSSVGDSFKVIRWQPSELQIGLLHCGTDSICRQDTNSIFKQPTLRAQGNDSGAPNKFWVEEPVRWRRMFDVDFRTEDARIYPLEPPKTTTDPYKNDGGTHEFKVTTKIGRTERYSTSWTNSYGWKVGGSVELTTEFKGIPFLKEGKIQISSEYSKESTEGGSKGHDDSSEIGSEVTVPPGKKVTITRTETKTACDVPFAYSYTQQLYYEDKTDTYRVEDGLFTTIVTTIEFTVKEEPL